MKTYLLFDSGCATCSKLAQAIQREVDGALTARSLRDPEMQELLVRTDPEWEWEPTLLEIRDEAVRAYTGIRLGLRLIRTLGPRKALRIMKLVGRHAEELQGKIGPADPSRRHFLQRFGSTLAVFTLLLGWPQTKEHREGNTEVAVQGSEFGKVQQQKREGEVWEGFVLLPTIDAP